MANTNPFILHTVHVPLHNECLPHKQSDTECLPCILLGYEGLPHIQSDNECIPDIKSLNACLPHIQSDNEF